MQNHARTDGVVFKRVSVREPIGSVYAEVDALNREDQRREYFTKAVAYEPMNPDAVMMEIRYRELLLPKCMGLPEVH